ncbi:MAG: hypothetical protein GX754_05735 [Clostridiaceae bacterium]|nr:hypothetical protein [Clostridiaceae bacterium]
MKRINVLVLTIVLAIILLIAEIIIIRSVPGHEPVTTVVFATRKIIAGETFTGDMLGIKEISLDAAHEKSIKNKNELIGKVAITDIEKDEVILESRVTSTENTEQIEIIDKNNRLITVEFKIDQANGWQLKEGQYVDIIFIPSDKNDEMAISLVTAINKNIGEDGSKNDSGVNSSEINGNGVDAQKRGQNGGIIQDVTGTGVYRIRNIRVAALMDEKGRLIRNNKNEAIPRYISFEVNDKLDEFIAYAKGNGRLELSVIPLKE